MVKETIPEGVPKSGRFWKGKETERASALKRKGVMSHMAKSFEEREAIRRKRDETKALEREMIEEKRQKKIAERERREAQTKRRMANEYKSASYQTLNPAKLKGMSKKQLRSVKKTAMNKNGVIELVNPWEAKMKKKTK